MPRARLHAKPSAPHPAPRGFLSPSLWPHTGRSRLSFQLGPEGAQALPQGPSAHPTPPHTSVHGSPLAVSPQCPTRRCPGPVGVLGSLEVENPLNKAGGQSQLVQMSPRLTVARQPHPCWRAAGLSPGAGLGGGGTRQKRGPGSTTVADSDESPTLETHGLENGEFGAGRVPVRQPRSTPGDVAPGRPQSDDALGSGVADAATSARWSASPTDHGTGGPGPLHLNTPTRCP